MTLTERKPLKATRRWLLSQTSETIAAQRARAEEAVDRELQAALVRAEAKEPVTPEGGPEEPTDETTGTPTPATPTVPITMPAQYERTDHGNAQHFAHYYRDRLLYVAGAGQWLEWNGRYWQPIETRTAVAHAGEMVNTWFGHLQHFTDSKERDAYYKHVKQSSYLNRLKAMVELAPEQPGMKVLPCDVNTAPWRLNVANGTIDLQTGERLKHDPQERHARVLDIPYDEKAPCPNFLTFLKVVTDGDAALQAYLQRCVGYTLSDTAREQCAFFLHGPGGTGKSTFLRVLQLLLGVYGCSLDYRTLLLRQPADVRYCEADLPGSRLAAVSELPQAALLDENHFKELTGGDTVRSRQIYAASKAYVPQFKLWIATNYKPVIREGGTSLWRRVRIIPFTAQPQQVNKNLVAELAEELPGILRWAVEGCLAWQQEGGLGEPQRVLDATQSYQEDEDPIYSFLRECTEQTPDGDVLNKLLFMRYEEWYKGPSAARLNQKTFPQKLENLNYKHKPTRDGKLWFGLELKPVVAAD